MYKKLSGFELFFFFTFCRLNNFYTVLIWQQANGLLHQGATLRFIPLWYCSMVVLMMCLCFSKTGGRRSNILLVRAFSFMWAADRMTESIRKLSCLLESDSLCWNTGISAVSTSLMKAYMGKRGKRLVRLARGAWVVHYSAFTFSSISSCMSEGMTIFPKMFSNSLQSLRGETILQVCETSPFLMCLQFSGATVLKPTRAQENIQWTIFFRSYFLLMSWWSCSISAVSFFCRLLVRSTRALTSL